MFVSRKATVHRIPHMNVFADRPAEPAGPAWPALRPAGLPIGEKDCRLSGLPMGKKRRPADRQKHRGAQCVCRRPF
jgi:hypothetical protein